MPFSPARTNELFLIGRDLAQQASKAIHEAVGWPAEEVAAVDPETVEAAVLVLTAMTVLLRVGLYKTFADPAAREKYIKLAENLYEHGVRLDSPSIITP